MSSRFLVMIIIFLLTIISLNNITANCDPDTTVEDAQCKIEDFINNYPYGSLIGPLLSDLSINTVAFDQYKYHISYTDDEETTRAYGLARCNSGLAGLDCMNCLGTAAQYLLEMCPYSVGGRVQMKDCFMRYDNFPFYDEYY